MRAFWKRTGNTSNRQNISPARKPPGQQSLREFLESGMWRSYPQRNKTHKHLDDPRYIAAATTQVVETGKSGTQLSLRDLAPSLDQDPASTGTSSTLFLGDALRSLALIPDAVVQTTVTSPPYWGLRDYGIKGQIGLEDELDTYLEALVQVFAEVHRVTRKDGTLWLNIGDAHTSGGRKTRAPDKKNPARGMSVRPDTPVGLKKKDLVGLPWRLAFALQRAGWYLRSDIIWEKPNAMPESVKDRPTSAHEYVFLFSKSEKYLYDKKAHLGPGGRNLRTVWSVNTKPCPEAHFAVYPPALVEPCVALASRPGDLVLDPFTGAGTTGMVAVENDRSFVGIELNPEYLKIARRRIDATLAREDAV